jgi:hypothetical protein
MKATIIRDSAGDAYSKKYGVYVNGDLTLINDTLNQLEENYEVAFGDTPTKEGMESALKFVSLLLAEIGETCQGTKKAMASGQLSFLIDDEVTKTVENITEHRTR